MSPTPEQQAREESDRQLKVAGWLMQSMDQLNLATGPGIAVWEFKLQAGFAEYLLFLDLWAAGVLEAKSKGQS